MTRKHLIEGRVLGPAGLAVPFLFMAVDYGLDKVFLENPQAAPQEPEAIS